MNFMHERSIPFSSRTPHQPILSFNAHIRIPSLHSSTSDAKEDQIMDFIVLRGGNLASHQEIDEKSCNIRNLCALDNCLSVPQWSHIIQSGRWQHLKPHLLVWCSNDINHGVKVDSVTKLTPSTKDRRTVLMQSITLMSPYYVGTYQVFK